MNKPQYIIVEKNTKTEYFFCNRYELDEFLEKENLSIHGEIIIFNEYIDYFGSFQQLF